MGFRQPVIVQGSNIFNPIDSGYLAWNYPGVYARTSAPTLTSGLLFTQRLRLPTSLLITNIVLYLCTIGVTLTAGDSLAGIFDKNGNLLGSTADQSGTWAGTVGLKSMALSPSPVTVNAGDIYVGFYSVGTTPPAFQRIDTPFQIPDGNVAGSLVEFGTANSGLTNALPNPFSSQIAGGYCHWVGLS